MNLEQAVDIAAAALNASGIEVVDRYRRRVNAETYISPIYPREVLRIALRPLMSHTDPCNGKPPCICGGWIQ